MVEITEYMNLPKHERQRHIRMGESCVVGNSYLSQKLRDDLCSLLGTTMPHSRKIHCCHACNNCQCINLHHVYWGTPSENQRDGKDLCFYSVIIPEQQDKQLTEIMEKLSINPSSYGNRRKLLVAMIEDYHDSICKPTS